MTSWYGWQARKCASKASRSWGRQKKCRNCQSGPSMRAWQEGSSWDSRVARTRTRLSGCISSRSTERISSVRLSRAPVAAGFMAAADQGAAGELRSEEHTSELQSLMRISYAVFCLKKKKYKTIAPYKAI